MASNHESELKLQALADRRGVWTTWGGGSSWEIWALDGADGDASDAMAQCEGVVNITRDVTAQVLDRSFQPPHGAWRLLIHNKYSSWSLFAATARDDSILSQLAEEGPGRWLCTGEQDTAGVIYVYLNIDGRQVLRFCTDGGPWMDQDTEEDGAEMTVFEAETYPRDWARLG